jgi:hypothetical protein
VTCPSNLTVFAAGGAVSGGDARVALTRIVPSADRRSVTVAAAALPGQPPAGWYVIAYAVCDWANLAQYRVAETGLGTATVECPGDTRVFSPGFGLAAGPEHAYVTEVAADVNLRHVRVTAAGPDADQTEVTAIAICYGHAASMRRLDAPSPAGGDWPKVATVSEDEEGFALYGVGATSTGDGVTLDALVPDPEGGAAWARGSRLGGPASIATTTPGYGHRAADDGDGDDGSVTGQAVLIGTFH